MDRKEMIKKLSEFLGVAPKYLGPPSFSYRIGAEQEAYIIDRYGSITNSEGRVMTLEEILNSQQPETQAEEVIEDEQGTEAEETIEISSDHEQEQTSIGGVEIELPLGNHTGTTLQNIVNMLYSKQHLIRKALEMTEAFMDDTFVEDLNAKTISTIEDFKKASQELGLERCPGLGFYFEEGTFSIKLIADYLTPDKINAFQQLAVLINESAKKQKRASFKQSQDDNPKYAFRTWLIRLGMNGSEYKAARKVLLSNLEGSGAFRKVTEKDE